MNKKILLLLLGIMTITSCRTSSSGVSLTSDTSTPIITTSGENSDSQSENTSEIPRWNGESVRYSAYHISQFGSATPAGVANYNESTDSVSIWNIDASLDNYGGVQTPVLYLDFSKAVIFEMDVIDAYSQYIVKLAVEGELEYYYVLSDDNTPGLISVNVVDSMLSTKYRERNTQPDPGYQNGWKYRNEFKHCTFHILAKGPDGERQTAELNVRHIAIYNNIEAITGIEINSPAIVDNKLSRLVASEPVSLSASVAPSTTDQGVWWASADENIATIDEVGIVNFVGVGRTTISAKSRVDQSKIATVAVDVLSGYENISDLKSALASLNYDGNPEDLALFNNLFKTTWAGDMYLQVTLEDAVRFVHPHKEGEIYALINYYNGSWDDPFATARELDGKAYMRLDFVESGVQTVYRNLSGQLFKEDNPEALLAAFAYKSAMFGWQKEPTYIEQGIIIDKNGFPQKYTLDVRAATTMINDFPSTFTDPQYWTIPDRTKQNLDPVIHALSPASLTVENNRLIMKQNKYPEAKYCFGGIVTTSMSYATEGAHMQILLQVDELNKMNDYVKTMWEIKVLYYDSYGQNISPNPLKISSGNEAGFHVIDFYPTYPAFRLYLVVNGSDIGAQFPDATMKIHFLKMYRLV